MTTEQFVAIGFWLPCGKGNFYRNSDSSELLEDINKNNNDISLLKQNKNSSLQISLFHRLYEIFKDTKFKIIIPILSRSRRMELVPEPEAVIFYADNMGLANKMLFLSSDKGFNILVASTSNDNIETVENYLYEFIVDRFQGSAADSINTLKEGIKRRDEYYKGILPFFQLNLIVEGLYNPNFDPRNFFASQSASKQKYADKIYSLSNFCKKITTKAILIKEGDYNHFTIKNFFEDPSKLNGASLYDGLFVSKNISNEILRIFLRHISADCLLTLKWNIESCRRTLLEGMLSSVHKQDKLGQLESNSSESSQMEEANEAQLRGYAMLIAAKLPIILNVNRYIESIYNSYENASERKEIEFLFKDWFGLVNSISENISRLEEAIAQSRMDNLLLEQQQMRAESETMAEIARVRQKNGGDSDSGASSAIALTNNQIAIMALILAILLFLKGVKYSCKFSEHGIKDCDYVNKEIYLIIFEKIHYLITNPPFGSSYVKGIIVALLIVITLSMLRFFRVKKLYIIAFFFSIMAVIKLFIISPIIPPKYLPSTPQYALQILLVFLGG